MKQDVTGDRVLVVDLDGTLIRSDMLYETFWSAFTRSWVAPFRTLRALFGGRAHLKARLSELSDVEAAGLPYNTGVLDYIRRWRADGGRTALVTATNRGVAERVAGHVGLFDEVHGSDATLNLKGPAKADFLVSRYGDGAFVYMGDEAADEAVWAHAAAAVLVDAPRRVRGRMARSGTALEEMSAPPRPVAGYLRALRPHQWLKNLLVFLPLLAAQDFSAGTLARAALAFVAFSVVASGVYVLNDLLDLDADRAHPRKRNRPLASGAVPLAHGTAMFPALFGAGFLLGAPLGLPFLAVLGCYFLLTLAYSLHFKRLVVIDIFLLAGLYTIRIVAGGAATGLTLSVWMLAFSIFFFFALAAVKRQAELVDGVRMGNVTAHGRGYHVDDLPLVAAMAVAAGYVSVLVMALYVNSPEVQDIYARPMFFWGVCLILLFWISRVVMLTHRGEMHDDPVVFAARDRTSLAVFALVVLLAAAGSVP